MKKKNKLDEGKTSELKNVLKGISTGKSRMISDIKCNIIPFLKNITVPNANKNQPKTKEINLLSVNERFNRHENKMSNLINELNKFCKA